MNRGMATTVVFIPHITAETIPRIMGVIIPDITAATSTGNLTTATGTFTRPDTPTTTAVPVITVAGIAVGIAGNTAWPPNVGDAGANRRKVFWASIACRLNRPTSVSLPINNTAGQPSHTPARALAVTVRYIATPAAKATSEALWRMGGCSPYTRCPLSGEMRKSHFGLAEDRF